MMSIGCLITDPPQFKPPKHTQPFLDATTADPDPNKVLAVEETEIHNQGTQTAITFSAYVTSQEDASDTGSAFQQLEAWLYIDYGFNEVPTRPYRLAIPANRIAAATTSDQKRRVVATWYPSSLYVEPGCHTVTLVVSHLFDDTQCPACPDDSSSVTWQILRCDMGNGYPCDTLPVRGARSCESLTNSCAAARTALQKSGADVLACPEGDTTDGGSQ